MVFGIRTLPDGTPVGFLFAGRDEQRRALLVAPNLGDGGNTFQTILSVDRLERGCKVVARTFFQRGRVSGLNAFLGGLGYAGKAIGPRQGPGCAKTGG